MKVTNQMIHKDVRLIGSILRKFTNGTTEERFRKAHQSELKKVDKAKAKKSKMVKTSLERPDGSQMRLVILQPKHEAKNVPAVLWLHGGGYVLGYPEDEISQMERFMDAADCVMVSPDYRLGLDKPYPAALEDAYLALLWLRDHAELFGARDKGEVNIAFQMPLYPMLDDRGVTESAKDNDAPMWDSNSNTIAWRLYLGELYGSSEVPPYAAPARLTDFSGLPPAYSYVGSIEPFYDETRIYFESLKAAKIPCRLDVYPGGFHGFDTLGANTPLGREARKRALTAFQEATKTCFKKQSR